MTAVATREHLQAGEERGNGCQRIQSGESGSRKGSQRAMQAFGCGSSEKGSKALLDDSNKGLNHYRPGTRRDRKSEEVNAPGALLDSSTPRLHVSGR